MNAEEINRNLRPGWTPRLAAISAFVLSIGCTFNGLNNAFGNPLLFLLCGGLLALLLLSGPPPHVFWKRVVPVILLVMAAYSWATTPLWAGNPATMFVPHYVAPDLMLSELLGAAGLVSAFLAGAMLAARRGALPRTIDWLLFFACANIAAGLLVREYAAELPWDLWHLRGHQRFTGTLSNANVAGTYYGMIALLALGRIVSDTPTEDSPLHRLTSAARWVALLLCAGACVITASRSAMASTIAGIIAVALAQWVRKRGKDWTFLTPMLLLLGLGAVAAVGLSDMLVYRLGLAPEESSMRVVMWTNYWGLMERSPWLGYGLGGFPGASVASLTDPRTAQALWTVNSPHNLILQLLLEGGLAFLLLLLAANLSVGTRIAKNMVRYGPKHGRSGIAAAICVAILCSMVDIALDVPALAALTLFLMGLLWERPQFAIRSASSDLASRQRSSNGK